MEPFEDRVRRGGNTALMELEKFFMGEGVVHTTLRRITAKLKELQIPYAVAGGMALNAHGYQRATTDVDILVNREGLQKIHAALEGLGYVAPFNGSKNLRETTSNTRIEFLITGDYPGDGKPKPMPFPDPSQVAVEIDGISYLSLPSLIELKLASGMTNPQREKDLTDVLELIMLLQLPRETVEQLNPYVRERFIERWNLAHLDDSH